MDDEDPQILDRARNGDRAAQQQVARHYYPRLRRWALLLAADPVLADEIVQEALLRFVRSAHTWDPGRPFAPWMRTIVRNVARTLLGRPSRGSSDEDVPSPESPADRLVAMSDTARAALAALAQLSPRQREVLDLCDWQGFAPTEAAAELVLDAATVRVHLHRGRQRLREILEADGRDVVELLREES